MVGQPGGTGGPTRPYRVLISYAHQKDAPDHADTVRRFWEFLRHQGIDARLDQAAAVKRVDWSLWMADEVRAADYVLVIASDAYRERAEGRSAPDDGRGVAWEARLIREAFYRDQHRPERFVPVVLPDQSRDGVPDFLGPHTCTVYFVSDFTVAGADELLRFLTAQPRVVEPPLGQVPVLDPLPGNAPRHRDRGPRHRPDSVVHNQISGNVSGVVIQAGNIGSLPLAGSAASWTPAHVVGGGVRGWRSAFQRAHSTLRWTVTVGDPVTDVEWYGPGVRQEFDGGWVLCALPDGPVVAVAESVWEALHAVDRAAPLAAVGFPVSGPVVGDDATHVALAGGSWGAGRLVRVDVDADWEWRPNTGTTPDRI